MTTAACACGQPSPHGYLCNDCFHRLNVALIAAMLLEAQLEIAIARLARISERNGGRTHGHPLPLDLRVVEVRDHLAMVLGGVLRDLNLPTTEARPA